MGEQGNTGSGAERIGTAWRSDTKSEAQAQIGSSRKAEIRENDKQAQVGSAWTTEIRETKKKVELPTPAADLKNAKESGKNLDLVLSYSERVNPEFGTKVEKLRQQSGVAFEDRDKQSIRKELKEYLKANNKGLYDELHRLDTIEKRLASGGKQSAKELTEVRKIQEQFYNPYGNLLDSAAKTGVQVYFPREGDKNFLDGPYAQLPSVSGVQFLASENQKYYFKTGKDPETMLATIASLPGLEQQISNARDKFGKFSLVVNQNKEGQTELKLAIPYNGNEISLALDPKQPNMEAVLDKERRQSLGKLMQTYNVDIAGEGATVIFRGAQTSHKAMAPTLQHVYALGDALKIAHPDMPPGDKALKIYWTDLGPNGVYDRTAGQANIYLSMKTSTDKAIDWDLSLASYVVIHELGHGAMESLDDHRARTAYIAEPFGWKDTVKSEQLIGSEGIKFCFSGYKDNPTDPLSPTVDLDKWVTGCPSKGIPSKDNPEVDRNVLEKKLAKKPFTSYFWNIEETAVEALTAYQAGETSRKRLAQANPEAYRRAQQLDNELLSRLANKQGGPLVRTIQGSVEKDAPSLRKQIKDWQDSNLK